MTDTERSGEATAPAQAVLEDIAGVGVTLPPDGVWDRGGDRQIEPCAHV
jgi:hypothetical protein